MVWWWSVPVCLVDGQGRRLWFKHDGGAFKQPKTVCQLLLLNQVMHHDTTPHIQGRQGCGLTCC